MADVHVLLRFNEPHTLAHREQGRLHFEKAKAYNVALEDARLLLAVTAIDNKGAKVPLCKVEGATVDGETTGAAVDAIVAELAPQQTADDIDLKTRTP